MIIKPLLLIIKNFIKYDTTYVTLFYGEQKPEFTYLVIWSF